MNLEKCIRDLAKSFKYQTLYLHTKEAGFPLFKNISDYTNNQILFLTYLGFYYNLYSDVALEYVIEKVFEDSIYEDAWSYYKTKLKGDIYIKKEKKEEDNPLNSFQWVKTKPKKRQK